MIEEVKEHRTHIEGDRTQDSGTAQKPNLEKTTTVSTTATVKRDSFVKRMLPVTGTFVEDSIVKMALKPFFILLNPAVIWAVFLIAFPSLWLVGISFVIAQIFGAPPYNLDTQDLG